MPTGSIRPFGLTRLLVGTSLLVGCSSSSPGASPDAGGAGQVLRIVPVSPTGHDHFFGVAFDPQG
ncbi:MAG TPA: hypothetical protein VF516_12325, partial [Kofleriaceae bacterium]